MTAIRLEGLAKRYGSQPVLEPLDLEIADGEFFTFVGPSGCGKSTLLALLAGIESPSAGRILFGSRRVDSLPPGERDVAMVFQSYALYPHMTVSANIAFPLVARRMSGAEIDREVERVAATLGLSELLARRPRELSGGQRQRVALARAIVRRPAVFLMDEPLSNLDARLRLETREELKRLHATLGITTVYVTHDQEEALALSDRIAVLSAGRIRQCGPPQQVHDRPADRFVAEFLGAPPICLVPSSLVRALPGVSARLGHRDASEVVAGLRPAEVLVHDRPQPGAIEARIARLESTGSDTWAIGEADGARLRGRLAPGAQPLPGSVAWFRIDPGRLHLFDRKSGVAIG
jgi:multiple sugar transport system ATP-binding protein